MQLLRLHWLLLVVNQEEIDMELISFGSWLIATFIMGCTAYPGDPTPVVMPYTNAGAPVPAPLPTVPNWFIVCKQINTVTAPARDAAWAVAH